MRGVVMHAPGDVRVEEREDPKIVEPTDAIIRLTATCVCGSDLWPYRGIEPAHHQVMGHEYVGVVEEIGTEVRTIEVGDFVVGSFVISDNTCEICQAGYQSQCVHASFVSQIGTQSEKARIPFADGTLVATPGQPAPELIPSLLAASDVLGTGWFAAVAAEAGPGKTVAVVGDGAVGLMGVLAAKQLGAERIIAIHAIQNGRNSPGTTVRPTSSSSVATKGWQIKELTGGLGAHSTQLERGNLRGASESVLNAIARALRLDDVERQHLFDLARTTSTTTRTRASAEPSMRASVQRVLDSLALPAVVFNAQQDLIAANLMGRALFAPHFEAEKPNLARFIFLDPRARDFYCDWPLARTMTAAMLRLQAGRDPLNQDLTALIGELSTLSAQFRSDWADQDVHEHRTGTKVYRHPEIGELEVTFDVFELPGQPGLSICTYSAQDDSPSAGKLARLATWAATQDFADLR